MSIVHSLGWDGGSPLFGMGRCLGLSSIVHSLGWDGGFIFCSLRFSELLEAGRSSSSDKRLFLFRSKFLTTNENLIVTRRILLLHRHARAASANPKPCVSEL